MREVSDAKCDGIEVYAIALDGAEIFCIRLEEGYAIGGFVGCGSESLLALFEHFAVDIRDCDVGIVIFVDVRCVVEEPESDIACATCYV